MTDILDLDVCKLAHRLTLRIYETTRRFPEDEKFGMSAQMRRSAASINMNLAEGSARRSKKDFSHFITMAEGSCRELRYQLILAKDLKYLAEALHSELSSDCVRIQMMLNRLRSSQKQKSDDRR